MIVLKATAIGRGVVYRGSAEGPKNGVVTRITPRRVFVRLGDQSYSIAVDPEQLEFLTRRRTDRPCRKPKA